MGYFFYYPSIAWGFFLTFVKMESKSLYFFLFLVLLVPLMAVPGCRNGKGGCETLQQDTVPPIGFWADSLERVQGTIRSGEIFTALMARLGLSRCEALALADSCRPVFDIRKMRAGNDFFAYYGTDSTHAAADSTSGERALQYVVYPVDAVDRIVFRCARPLNVWKYSRPVVTTRRFSDVTIRSCLWNDMTAAGMSPDLILSLSEIYAWTVDFFGLQPGDRFKVLYGQRSVEGTAIGIDPVYYAEFLRDTTVIPAVRFDQGNGGNLYWNAEGESLRKAFLKAPLQFTRISSGFSYHRRHPISGRVKPHTAVDYAAPKGTPVMSIGDGTVLSAGWSGGGGNTVKIRHNSTYTTAYLHLSGYARGIKAGARVRQGEVIGYVGSTGASTGPHLDFRVWKNGTPVNPLKLESPPADPVLPQHRPALDSVLRRYRQLADSLAIADTLKIHNTL